jgi:hypothetical protein
MLENLNYSQEFEFLQARQLQNIAHKSSYDLCKQSPHLPLSSSRKTKSFQIETFATNTTMGIRHDVEQGLEKYEITKIDGQPTDEDLNLLTKELTNAAGSVAT